MGELSVGRLRATRPPCTICALAGFWMLVLDVGLDGACGRLR